MLNFIFGVYALISVTAACLLFSVQPLVTKTILPLFGGSPQVWNTCSFFFQLMLLFGYLYAHWLTTRLKYARQMLVHFALLAAALFLPLRLYLFQDRVSVAHPIAGILFLLTAGAGFPFFVLSSTAPLIQKWFSRLSHRGAGDPYLLYAASNFGSLAGLLLYPFFIEPTFKIAQQRTLWVCGYGALSILLLAAGWLSWKFGAQEDTRSAETSSSGRRISGLTILKWTALAFVPSSLTLSVTSYMSTDIAAIPLFWIIPLSIYLISFMIVFSKNLGFAFELSARLFPIFTLLSLVVWKFQISDPLWFVLTAQLCMLFLASIYFNGKLSMERPPKSQLTFFYVCLSFGGILGALFNAILTPVLFNTIFEFPLVATLAIFLWSGRTSESRRQNPKQLGAVLVFGLTLAAASYSIEKWGGTMPGVIKLLFRTIPPVLAYAFVQSPVCFGIAACSLLFLWRPDLQTLIKLYQNRSFFSVHTVYQNNACQRLEYRHGTTAHGMQSMLPELKNFVPTEGPFSELAKISPLVQDRSKIAVIGLGVGMFAAFSREAQEWDYFEIDPEVAKIAEGPFFSYLKNSKSKYRIIVGDGRLEIAKESSQKYQMIILDAFSSASVPVHLLTREAMAIYLDKLAPEGMLVFNISNRYLDLRRVLAGLASEQGLAYAYKGEVRTAIADCVHDLRNSSNWIVMFRQPAQLEPLKAIPGWSSEPPAGMVRGWSDDYSNLLQVLLTKVSAPPKHLPDKGKT